MAKELDNCFSEATILEYFIAEASQDEKRVQDILERLSVECKEELFRRLDDIKDIIDQDLEI